METSWILFSLLSLFALWLGDFIKKLMISKWWDKDVFLSTCFVLFIFAFWINYFFQWIGVFTINTLKAAFIIGSCNFVIPLGILTSFKYLNISFALVTMRIVTSSAILFIGIFLLDDSLSLYNLAWFILWFIAIFLLSGFKWWATQEKMHPKWIIALCWAIIWIIISNSYYKYVVADLPIHDYTPLQFSFTGAWIVIYMILRKKTNLMTKQAISKIFWFALLNVSIFVVYFLYLLPTMYLLWPLSLSYKMLSYSLVVPILLSVIFLWEPVNRTRIIAFWLTIISIFLFLV